MTRDILNDLSSRNDAATPWAPPPRHTDIANTVNRPFIEERTWARKAFDCAYPGMVSLFAEQLHRHGVFQFKAVCTRKTIVEKAEDIFLQGLLYHLHPTCSQPALCGEWMMFAEAGRQQTSPVHSVRRWTGSRRTGGGDRCVHERHWGECTRWKDAHLMTSSHADKMRRYAYKEEAACLKGGV